MKKKKMMWDMKIVVIIVSVPMNLKKCVGEMEIRKNLDHPDHSNYSNTRILRKVLEACRDL